MKQLVCSRFSARCVVVLNFCWSISLHPKIGQCQILAVGAGEGPHISLLLSADLLTAVPVKGVVNAEVLNLMWWTGFLGNEVFTRQVSRAIRYGDNHEAHSRDSPQVFKCSAWRGWTLGSQSHSWFFLKLNCRQKELRLEHSAKMYIFGSHFSFLLASLWNCLKWKGRWFHLSYVSDEIEKKFIS